uniref:Major facilitator superfamily (MFS) profile domain-containing protein n=1 Tax=Myripristis murdjan TaxID=586833 RepID=A0A668AY80_9TELE
MKDYDETTAFLGQWGCFQQMVFFLLCATGIPNGFSGLSVVFLADIPPHHCLVPEANLTQEDVNLTDLEQEGCLDGWSYSRDTYQSTIVTEFNLVCGEQWKQPVTSTAYFLGVLCGSFISGQLSDRFGRRPVLFATMAVQTIFTFIQIFSPSWTVFTILFFTVGLGQISNYVAALVLGSEILAGKVRVLFASLGITLSYATGYMMLPLFAYFLRGWKSLLLALSLPGLLYIPFWWFIPESPRWLLTQGRVKEAEAVLRNAAKRNKIKAPQDIFKDYNGKPEERHSVLDLVRTSNIRTATIILILVSSLNIAYFCLSLNTSQLHGNPYVSCFLSAAVEVPAYIFSWLSLHRLPRRFCAVGTLLLGGLSIFVIQLVPQKMSVALEMLGKFGISMGLAQVIVFSTELYPTVIRNTATGTFYTFSRVGSAISPYLFQLSTYYKYLHYNILGSLVILSAVGIMFLPETFGRPLPETIQQMHKREK